MKANPKRRYEFKFSPYKCGEHSSWMRSSDSARNSRSYYSGSLRLACLHYRLQHHYLSTYNCFNALVIIAVTTKHRLNTNTNIALACLSTTDLAMGVIGQPLSISKTITELQGNTSGTYCVRTLLATIGLRVLSSVSLSHLAMMNVERYIAIKHALKYETIVTKNRLICLSSLLWVAELPLTVPLWVVDNKLYFRVENMVTSFCIATIFFCQVLLYHETSRHQKQFANQQVSLEAREKFLRRKKLLN